MVKPKGPLALRRSRRIHVLIDKKTEENIRKGQGSEDLTEEALQILVNQREIPQYLRSDWGDKYDSSGIDFLVWLETGLTVPLQVKSSRRGEEKHFETNRWVSCCVVVAPYDTPETLAEKILEELGLSVEFLKPIIARNRGWDYSA